MAENKAKRNKFTEFFRKFVVSLKKNPKNIALFALVVCFVEYALSLIDITNTTALIQETYFGLPMGFAQFVAFLCSVLAFVCAINAYPRREKVKVAMLALLFTMLVVISLADVTYLLCVNKALTKAVGAIELTPERAYVVKAMNAMKTHIVLLVITILLFALMPLYAKLLRKINTSVEIETNEGMGEIELEEDAGE